MKVRILSGNLAGQVVDMDKTEAEANLATGFVELVVEAGAPAPPVEEKKAVTSRSWRSKADHDER
jgi:hypothetical protein